MISSIGNTAVWTSNLDGSERFYVDSLGLDVLARIETPDMRQLIIGRTGSGSQLMLAQRRSDQEVADSAVIAPAFSPAHDAPQPHGLWKTFLWTDDLHGDLQRVAAGHGTIVRPAQSLDDYGLTVAVVADPDGYLLELGEMHSVVEPHVDRIDDIEAINSSKLATSG